MHGLIRHDIGDVPLTAQHAVGVPPGLANQVHDSCALFARGKARPFPVLFGQGALLLRLSHAGFQIRSASGLSRLDSLVFMGYTMSLAGLK